MRPAAAPRAVTGWLRRHGALVDAAIAGVLWLMFAAWWVFTIGHSQSERSALGVPYEVWALLISSVQTVMLAWRRRRAVLVFTAFSASCLVQLLVTNSPLPANACLLLAAYALARYAASDLARRAGLVVCALSGVLAAADWYGPHGMSGQALVVATLFLSGVVVVCWFWGDLNRKRAAMIAGLEAQNAALIRERDQRERLAASAERTRIARDMHDVVAHSLSVIVVQADGAAYAAEHASAFDREAATRSLETIAGTARVALEDTRRLVGVLRDEQAGEDRGAYAPTAGIDDLPELVASVRSAGHDVRLTLDRTVVGAPPHEVGLAAYRVVQEGLTNVLKHAGPAARTIVAVEPVDNGIVVRVEDDGRGASAADDGMGSGLIGMRERVAAVGGTLEAGPRPGGGYAVTATLPGEVR